MGHSIHLQLTLSSTSAEWSKVSRLGRKVACQTAKRRGKTLAALSRDWLGARSTHSVILQKTTQRMHACLKGFSMLLAHIVAYLCCRKLYTMHGLLGTPQGTYTYAFSLHRRALFSVRRYRISYGGIEETLFVHLERLPPLPESALTDFFFNNPIRRSFHRVLHEFTGLGNTVSKSG